MVSAISTAVGGFIAATNRLDKVAVTIANSPSLPDPTTPSSDSTPVFVQPANDPAQNLVQAHIASYDAQANLSVIKVDQKNFQALLNIVS